MDPQNSVRNFSIIAHIDHGKTTLTDRFLESTGTVEKRLMHERFLDSHPISQERGVTIKLAPARMEYRLSKKLQKILNFEFSILNLIDTPGHIDFSYEVSRSLACCEGAVLLVDAAQGIQAQTLANFSLAQKLGLKIVPVVNKIDLINAQPEKLAGELINTFNFKKEEIIFASAKTGKNVDQILEAIVERIPAPKGEPAKPLRALVFDSFYDVHKGVVIYLKIVDGVLELVSGKKQIFQFLASSAEFEPLEAGYLKPGMVKADRIKTGEIGYLATGLKDINLCRVGDTVTKLEGSLFRHGRAAGGQSQKPKVKQLSGYKDPKPVVFFDFYPVENKDFTLLKEAIQQLKLNDVSLFFSPTGSPALGNGFRMGFLGVFHALITQERLERDYNLSIVITSPSVAYKLVKEDGSVEIIKHAGGLTDISLVKEIQEPWIEVSIFTPNKYMGQVFDLCQDSRGTFLDQEYFGDYVKLKYQMPLIELVEGFYDRLKSCSSGFASFDYKLIDFKSFNAVKLEVLINKVPIDALSLIVEKQKAEKRAKKIANKLKKIIPRQLFEIPIQVALNGKIIARETIRAYRKDVTAKLYGGDQTRKDKLLKKQKKGKKRMKQVGSVNIPQEAFMSILEAK